MTSGTRQWPSQIDSHPQTPLSQWRRWSCLGRGLILMAGLTISGSLGCNALLPTTNFLTGRINRGPTTPETGEEFVLVDRTGQPLPEKPTESSSNTGPTAQPVTDSLEVEQVISRRTNLHDEPAIAEAFPTARTNSPVSTHSPRRIDPASDSVDSTPVADIRVTGPNQTTSNTAVPVESSQGESFRVQVTDVAPNGGDHRSDDQSGLTPAELAASQSMVQAIQQVTQQGLGRIAGGRSDSNASPALANLLMNQVQQSISTNQMQQATLALQNLESAAEFPAFDLRSNRPVNIPPAAPSNQILGSPSVALASASETAAFAPLSADTSTTDVDWRSAIKQAIDSIDRSIAQTSNAQERESLEIYLRLLRLIAHDPEQAVRSIDSLPKQRQNFWREQIFALSQIIQAPEADQEVMFVNHSRQATKALAHLQNAIDSLKSEATLQLRQVQFCQEIRSFGDYDLARTTLVAPGDPMLVYCEVFNYTTQRSNDAGGDHYQTSLLPSYLIMDANQQVVSQKEFAVVRDRCRSRRQDFYLVLQVDAPNLPPGKYHLQFSVEDLEAGKIAVSAPLTFQIRK